VIGRRDGWHFRTMFLDLGAETWKRKRLGAVLLGESSELKEGRRRERLTNTIMSVACGGRRLIGRVVNPLGLPLDDKGPIHVKESATLWKKNWRRAFWTANRWREPLQTGIKAH